MMNRTRYYKFDIGNGLMRRTGITIEYLDRNGNWIEDRNLIRKFVGGDTDFDEISFEQAQRIIDERCKK